MDASDRSGRAGLPECARSGGPARGCPGRPGGRSMSHQVISDQDEAARWGMHGSPTLLIDGVDPFAELGQPPGMSCRLYRDDEGRTSGAPSAGQLRHAIEQALSAAAGPGDPGWLDALGRAGRGRLPPAERGLRAVHQAVLRSFVHTGAAPGISSLARHAAPFDGSQVLAELADGQSPGALTMLVTSRRPTRSPRGAADLSGADIRRCDRVRHVRDRRPGHIRDGLRSRRDRIRRSVYRPAGYRERRPGRQHRGSRPQPWCMPWWHRRPVRRAVSIGLLRVYQLLRHPGSRVGVGSHPSGDRRRYPGSGPRCKQASASSASYSARASRRSSSVAGVDQGEWMIA